MILSPDQVLERGLWHRGVRLNGKRALTLKRMHTMFHSNYGSSPLVLADMWYDLVTTTDIPKLNLTEKEKGESGFKRFMVAQQFLWTYPKNTEVLAVNMTIAEKYCRGKGFWRWVGLIAALKVKKITMDPNYEADMFATVDGTDFRTWERKHATMKIDKGLCTKKFNHAALKYELAVDIHRSKIIWINGPFRGGLHDSTIYSGALKCKIAPGKYLIADRGYKGHDEIALPNPKDPKALRQFMSRARSRHETLNGRLKNFAVLANTFRQSVDKHKLVFEAVCVTVQYQMDHGAELFVV